ncbi:uncharacterized protein FTOL_02109 [Fusarium torulosum]|uniref:Ankyrin n=1 Tax=Fusarium torulosum TaxID=33205 RepID=A0AAE8M187_9HYPO|nr:uncharacterized protein FTOL_02109 [Fusarium torulosum]
MSTASTVNSSSSSDVSGDELPIIFYSGRDGLRNPTDDLVHAVLAGDVTRARQLSVLGFSIPAADSWLVYQACLQGVKMVHSLSFNPRARLNRVMPWQMGDRNFHFLLRTPADRFLGTKTVVITYLIQHGAHPLEPDRLGNTALHILSEVPTQTETDGFGILSALLEEDNGFVSERVRKACLSAIDTRNIPVEPGEGSTPLMCAVTHGHVECVKILLEHGASPHFLGPSYQSPLYHAVTRDFTDLARVLLEYGAVVTRAIEEEVRSFEMTQVLGQWQAIPTIEDSSEASDD